MNSITYLVLFILLWTFSRLQFHHCAIVSLSVGSLLASTSVGLLGLYSNVENIKCLVNECCRAGPNDYWINTQPNFAEMDKIFFGQHIALSTANEAIKYHLVDESPSNALVLSFHGSTGVGKTYFSKLIASAIYTKYNQSGSSSFVHFIHGSHIVNNQELAKNKIIELIHEKLHYCDRSLFIIDEIDKLPERFLDILVPFIEGGSKEESGRNHNKAIFILLGFVFLTCFSL